MNDSLTLSNNILEQTRKINVFTSLIIIAFGLIGHFLTIYLFIQKKYRTNSSNVYMLCLAIFDGLFLILHLFEDIIRTYLDIYDPIRSSSSSSSSSSLTTSNLIKFLRLINITDNIDLTCKIINYFRYMLRMISAYVIVAFTIQRLIIVYLPLGRKFKSTRSAWLTVCLIGIISMLLNIWVFYLFEINKNETSHYCDAKRSLKSIYFGITVIYITVIMLIPCLIIFICNCLIIRQTNRSDMARRSLQMNNNNNNKHNHYLVKNNKSITNNTRLLSINNGISNSSKSIKINNNNLLTMKVYYMRKDQKNMRNNLSNSQTVLKTLLFISFTYAILNLPYFIAWSVFFYEIAYNKIKAFGKNYLFTALQITEIFYILNYSIYFYINFILGSSFRDQFLSASKYIIKQ